jgi:hypothetical protein
VPSEVVIVPTWCSPLDGADSRDAADRVYNDEGHPGTAARPAGACQRDRWSPRTNLTLWLSW